MDRNDSFALLITLLTIESKSGVAEEKKAYQTASLF